MQENLQIPACHLSQNVSPQSIPDINHGAEGRGLLRVRLRLLHQGITWEETTLL